MAGAWLDIEDGLRTRRVALEPGLTRVGGGDADIGLPGVGTDELHVWDAPPRAIFVGQGEPPRLNGAPLAEHPLRPGDRIEWRGTGLVFGSEASPAAPAALEEIPLGATETDAGAPAAGRPGGEELRFLRRMQAGLFLELGLAERSVAKRWQDAVLQERFDADACAHEVVTKSLARTDDPRLVERSGRLLRDFLMAPLVRGMRGQGRRARQAARGGFAFLVAQASALLIYSVIVLAALLLLRLRGIGIDDFLDRILMR